MLAAQDGKLEEHICVSFHQLRTSPNICQEATFPPPFAEPH